MYAVNDGLIGRRGKKTEQMRNRAPIEFAIKLVKFEDRLEFGPEKQSPAVLAVVQRLDAEPVARHEQLPAGFIPKRKCKHATQMFNAVLTVLFVEMYDRFRVRARGENVPPGFQIAPQFAVVVDFSIEHQVNRAVLVFNRLVSGSKVDDAQTPHRETRFFAQVEALIIGTAMGDHRAHVAQFLRVHRLASQANDSRDSAHRAVPYPFPNANVRAIATDR